MYGCVWRVDGTMLASASHGTRAFPVENTSLPRGPGRFRARTPVFPAKVENFNVSAQSSKTCGVGAASTFRYNVAISATRQRTHKRGRPQQVLFVSLRRVIVAAIK